MQKEVLELHKQSAGISLKMMFLGLSDQRANSHLESHPKKKKKKNYSRATGVKANLRMSKHEHFRR